MDWIEFVEQSIPTPQTVTVEALTGVGAYGDTYAAAVDYERCYVEHGTKRVKVATADAAGGIKLATIMVAGPPDMVAPIGSRVTLADGTVSKVLEFEYLNAHGHPIPEHVELLLE